MRGLSELANQPLAGSGAQISRTEADERRVDLWQACYAEGADGKHAVQKLADWEAGQSLACQENGNQGC